MEENNIAFEEPELLISEVIDQVKGVDVEALNRDLVRIFKEHTSDAETIAEMTHTIICGELSTNNKLAEHATYLVGTVSNTLLLGIKLGRMLELNK